MNRKQRRRYKALFVRANIESVPKPTPANDSSPSCDWLGCSKEWQFSTMATVQGKRKVIARRCEDHRLSQRVE
jgi:hypothetical protein